MMKQVAVFVLLTALCLASIPDASAITRHSSYQFPKQLNCNAITKFRKQFFKLQCKGCVVTQVVWNGAAYGYDPKKDYNCLVLAFYPSRKVFEEYQAKEKANPVYKALKSLAKLNGNFMSKA